MKDQQLMSDELEREARSTLICDLMVVLYSDIVHHNGIPIQINQIFSEQYFSKSFLNEIIQWEMINTP